ncbi:MAG: bifunctional nuclease family protein [Planctomycetes bacterium]|nr:bifunctional nuclease family protein [Planctomycetota bacterium]
MSEARMIEVLLGRIVIHEQGDSHYIVLVEKGGKRQFPIVIGRSEVAEIRRVVSNEEVPRPLTHQLAHTIAKELGAEVVRTEIVNLARNTFFAALVLRRDGVELTIDSRPSDAVALALRAKAPIFVAESVLEQVRTDQEGPDPLPPKEPEQP